MKFSIRLKLYLLTVLPMILVAYFSFTSLSSAMSKYDIFTVLESKLIFLQKMYTLLYDLDMEYITLNSKKYKDAVQETDKTLLSIQTFDRSIFSAETEEAIDDLIDSLSELQSIRNNQSNIANIQSRYTNLKEELYSAVTYIRLYSEDYALNFYILSIKNIFKLHYYSAKKRDDIMNILDTNEVTYEKYELFFKDLELQRLYFSQCVDTIDDDIQLSQFVNIFTSDKQQEVDALTSKLKTISAKGIDIEDTTLNQSTIQQTYKSMNKQLEELYQSEIMMYLTAYNYLKELNNKNFSKTSIEFTLLFILISFTVIFNYRQSNYLVHSIKAIESTLKSFFIFLDNSKKIPQPLTIDSNDELSTLAKSINFEVNKILKFLKNDETYIKETIDVVNAMEHGRFGHSLENEPHNSNLKELATSFDGLLHVIDEQIKQQTIELEVLNESLEVKVQKKTDALIARVKELQIEKEKVLKSEKLKDEFFSNMSHEIRTPLNAILGFIEILYKKNEDEKTRYYLNIIRTSSKSLLHIISDILDLSKINNGKLHLNSEPFDALEVLSSNALLFSSKTAEKNIVFNAYIDPHIPNLIGDSTRITQVISNIMSNAIKFSDSEGEIKYKALYEKNTLNIDVVDTGIGMSSEEVGRVFNAFEQADGSTTRKYGGTGLGLSVCSKLVEVMGGEITVNSKLHIGSHFKISIPLLTCKDSQSHSFDLLKELHIGFLIRDNTSHYSIVEKYLNEMGVRKISLYSSFDTIACDLLFITCQEDRDIQANSTILLLRNELQNSDNSIKTLALPIVPLDLFEILREYTTHSIEDELENELLFDAHILVAEDNKTNQLLISMLLDDYGISYVMSENGIEAFEAYQKERFDIILMDENMPELNGLGATKLIREYETKNCSYYTPIVAVSADVQQLDRDLFMQGGMDEFIAKPIENNLFEQVLKKYLTIRK